MTGAGARHPPGRLWLAVVTVIVVLAALVGTAEIVVRVAATRTIEREIARESGAESVNVRLKTTSALVSLVTKKVRGLYITVIHAEDRGVSVDEMVLILEQVDADPGGLVGTTLQVGSGRALVTLSAAAVNARLGAAGRFARVNFTRTGTSVTFDLPRRPPVTVAVDVDVDNGRLVLTPETIQSSGHRIDLPASARLPGIPLGYLPPVANLVSSQSRDGTLNLLVDLGSFTIERGRLI
jgi:hypothetical protein